jgi:hypothetical protein
MIFLSVAHTCFVEISATAKTDIGKVNADGSGNSGSLTLEVTKNGMRTGTVTSSPSGISGLCRWHSRHRCRRGATTARYGREWAV